MALKVREQDTFILMDAQDEQQILKEMEGEIVKDLYYDVNGKKGLSYVGVNHMSFKLGGVKVLPESIKVEYDSDTEEYVASCVAVNTKYDLSRAGMSVQPKMMDVYDRDSSNQKIPDGQGGFKMHKEYDKFARIKALSKAQRNAVKAVIPEALIAAYLDYFVKLKQGTRAAVPRDDGPIGMKDPRKVEANYTVKDSAALHDEHDANASASLIQDIRDALEAGGLQPDGVEIVSGREWNSFIIKKNWPTNAPRETWGKYHEALKPFGAIYHGKEEQNPDFKGNWTIGVA